MDGKRNIPPYLVVLLIVVTMQMIGFALLWNAVTSQQQYIYLPTQNNQDTTAGAQTNTVVAVTKFPTESVLRETIQSVLKQELASYARQLTASPEARQNTSANTPDVKENSPENAQAFTEATTTVGTAIAQGKWTRAYSLSLQRINPHLTHDQRRKILENIADAINRQELSLEDTIPPL